MRTLLAIHAVIVCALTVHLVAGQQSCTSGFISLSDLMTLAPTGGAGRRCNPCERDREQRLIPAISFTCRGIITKWIFGADFDSRESQFPELQLWRLQAGTSYTKVGSCSIQNTVSRDSGRVYECMPTSELRFEAGDVLGIFQPRNRDSRLTMYHDVRSGQGYPTNYIDRRVDTAATTYDTSSADETENALPLVTVEILVDCGSLTDPENGQVTLTGTTEGSTANYSCNTGYSLMGVNMRTCQSDGMWSDQPPVCTRECGSLTDPENGQVTLTGTTEGSTATYSCDTGYDLMGVSMRTCQNNGQWSGQPPACTPVDCGSLTRPMNGQVTVTGSTLDSTATYSCDQGYDLMGLSMRTCQSDGQWSDQPPVCTPVDCGDLNNPENGLVILTGTTLGSTATYSCDEGYNVVGTSTRICRSNGMWSDQSPICKPVDCGSLADLANGQVTVTGTTLDSTATYSCDQGYDLMGVSVRTCQTNGQWSDQLPICIRNSAVTTPEMVSMIPTSQTNTEGPSFESTLSTEPPSPTTSVPPVSETPTLQDPTEDPTDTMIPPQESSTASAPPLGNTGSSSSSASAAIAGAVVGGFIAVLLAFTVVVLLLIILRRRRRRRKDGDGTATGNVNNPVYSADHVPGKYTYTGGDTSNQDNDYDDVAFSSSGIYQSVEEQPQYYEEPAEVKRAMENGVPSARRRNIYNTLSSDATNSKLLAAESLYDYEDAAGASATFYQWGVYIPSEEERRALATGDGQTSENIYADLGEVTQTHVCPSPTYFEDSDIYWAPSSDKNELYGQLARKKYREIPRPQVQITDTLGEGQFGTVEKGMWQSPAGAKEVAVKTLKSQASETDAVKFLQEAAINGQFKHPNVVKLFGVVTIGEPVMIVLELLANGDLRHYLNKQQPAPGELIPSSTPPMLLNFCQQVAAGMEYLARKAFVHRDLAARNILVSENKTCKVSDFGMSRDLADENYYVSHGGKIPVKWTAPEALHYKKYSTASDVWSFGAVMYEIWSLGRKPFEGHTNAETIKLVDSGYRLPPPPGCPKELYKWMIECWHPERYTRPQFSQLSEALSQPDFDLLTWSEEDAGVHPQAMVLGAPLEAGKQLYPELQDTYIM